MFKQNCRNWMIFFLFFMPRAITPRVYSALRFENKGFCKRYNLINFDTLLVVANDNLFELNRRKPKINGTVLTCCATGFVEM